MGYFKNSIIDRTLPIYDYSIPFAPEQQLLWRVDELKNRYENLGGSRTVFDTGVCYSDLDLRHILPEYLHTLADVRRARQLAIRDLAEQFDVHIEQGDTSGDPQWGTPGIIQLTFCDLFAVQSLRGASMNP